MNLDRFSIIPHVRGGRNFAGADCYGVFRLAFMAMVPGVELPLWSEVGARDVDAEAAAIEAAITSAEWLPVAAPRRCDGVLLNVRQTIDGVLVRAKNHVGIMIDETRMMHSVEERGVVIFPIDHVTVRNDICGFFRHRSLA